MKIKPVGGYLPADLRNMPTLCTGQCCSLKIDDGKRRVWLCRVAGGVSIERYDGRRWEVVNGGCQPEYDE